MPMIQKNVHDCSYQTVSGMLNFIIKTWIYGKKFKDNKFIDVAAFPTLLESSDVLLSESEIEAMIKEM